MRVITLSVHVHEAHINLNDSHYVVDASMFEVLTLMWTGRRGRGGGAREEGGGAWVDDK